MRRPQNLKIFSTFLKINHKCQNKVGDFCGLLGISVVSGDMKIRMSNLKFKSLLDSNLSTYTKIEMSKAHWEKVQNVKRGQMPCQSYSSYKPGEKLAIAVYTAIQFLFRLWGLYERELIKVS